MADVTPKIDSLLDTIADNLGRLVTLNVTTVVCKMTVVALDAAGAPTNDANAAVDWKLAPPPAGSAEAWCTEINLLDGKIRDTLTASFADGTLTSMTEFHKSQVDQAKSIVHGNIKALINLAKTVKQFV